jgi:ArsR family transcriptional regulator
MKDHILLLKTLADPTRLKLLRLTLQEELCVCELQELLQISQPAVSQHIAKLKIAGIITERRAGMWTYYKGDLKRIQSGLAAFATFLTADPARVPEMAGEVARRTTLNRAELCCDTKGAYNK